MDSAETAKERLKKMIETHAFIEAKDERIVSRKGRNVKTEGWIFDLRRILMRADVLKDLGELFSKDFKDRYPLQVGGLETAAIPLATALTLRMAEESRDPHASGFFIRKSRKKDGLMRMIEGEIKKGAPIILVDDLTNSGKSLIRQIEVLESLGHTVTAVWTVIRFRDSAYYTYFHERGIEIQSLFTLDDFTDTLGTKNLVSREKPPRQQPFRALWKFTAGHPSYFHIAAKSDPAIDRTHLYVGSDDGVMWALEQSDGSVAWSYRIGMHDKGKGIFSSPAVFDDTVYFGGYDGNFYALEAATGKKKWVFLEADWIGSSPALAPDLGLLFVGLEFGLFRRRGGIVALDTKTGKKKWDFHDMPCLTHSSPHYIKEKKQVVIGSNDGTAYLFDAKSGKLVWEFETGSVSETELNAGFSARDIKESFAYDARRDLIIFGNTAGELCFLERRTGREKGRFRAEFGFFSTPLIVGDAVYASSVDKHLYCIDLDTFLEKWRWHSGARIFASPTLIDGSIYIGSNAGRLSELDPATGAERSFLTLTERINNKPAYNPETKRLFVPTFANEIYCLEKLEEKSTNAK